MAALRKYRIIVCRGPECGEHRGSAAVHAAFVEAVRVRRADVELGWQSCFGRCRQGPNVLVRAVSPTEGRFLFAMAPPVGGQNAALYNGVSPSDAERIVDQHVLGGVVVRELIRLPEGDR